jgi:hypothetical protein
MGFEVLPEMAGGFEADHGLRGLGAAGAERPDEGRDARRRGLDREALAHCLAVGTEDGNEPEAALHPALVVPAPLGLQGLGQKPLGVQIPLGRRLTDAVKLGQEVLHLHPLEEGDQFHWATSSYPVRGRRSTSRACAQRAAW